MFDKNNFWSAQGLTHITIGLNIASFLFAKNKSLDDYAYSISDNNSVSAMFVSMVTHVNAQHLAGNMLSLFFTSLSVFADGEWNSPWAFLLIYIPSGLVGFLGNSLLWHVQQRRRQQTATSPSPFHSREAMAQWMETVWNDFSYKSAQERYVVWSRGAVKRVGASGAVYGVVGARIYTALWSPNHASLDANDVRTLLCLMGEELPRSFDSTMGGSNAMVDHTAHLFGFVTGMATAWMWDTWLTFRRTKLYARDRKSGGGMYRR